jgi:hypothetical protein
MSNLSKDHTSSDVLSLNTVIMALTKCTFNKNRFTLEYQIGTLFNLFENKYNKYLLMKRNSIRKASSFKLQAARVKFDLFLQDVPSCSVAQKHPSCLEVVFIL